jgi:hypothetical protein
MLLDCPSSAPHDQPAMQVLAELHVVVHTLPFPTGRQIPLGQSEFFLHCVPVPFAGAF